MLYGGHVPGDIQNQVRQGSEQPSVAEGWLFNAEELDWMTFDSSNVNDSVILWFYNEIYNFQAWSFSVQLFKVITSTWATLGMWFIWSERILASLLPKGEGWLWVEVVGLKKPVQPPWDMSFDTSHSTNNHLLEWVKSSACSQQKF